jgi:hypothetical protein
LEKTPGSSRGRGARGRGEARADASNFARFMMRSARAPTATRDQPSLKLWLTWGATFYVASVCPPEGTRCKEVFGGTPNTAGETPALPRP